MMKITIHRGCHEIGGSCVELVEGQHSLLLDIGLPLNPESEPIDVAALAPDAVLVSHPHMDHFGPNSRLRLKQPKRTRWLDQETSD